MTPPPFLIGVHGTRGRLWACIAQSNVEPAVAETRFGAYLRPFRSEADARAALEAAQCDSIAAEVRKRKRRG